MNDIELRDYEQGDQDAVWQLHVDGLKQTNSFVEDPTLDEDLNRVVDVYREFLIATIGNEIVGMGALREVDSQTAEIKRMRVTPAQQRKGIGSQIIDRLLSSAKQLGYEKVILDTSENQEGAQHLYEKKGFTESKRSMRGELENIHYELDI